MTMKDIKVSDELLAASELAREQQEAMQRTADQLIASLAEVRNELGALRAEVGAAKGVIPAIKTAADDAITTAGTRACAGMADTIARATSMATVPVVAKLDGAVRASGDLEGKLKRAAVWLFCFCSAGLSSRGGRVRPATWRRRSRSGKRRWSSSKPRPGAWSCSRTPPAGT